MEKTIKIIPPEGYEVDKEKSTFDKIVFKKIKNNLPMSWEELKEVKGYYVSSTSDVDDLYIANVADYNRNLFPTRKEAEAMLAMAQLCQLRDAWNGGWKPDWHDSTEKYCIVSYSNDILKNVYYNLNCSMYFKTRKLRDKFMETFKDLLKIAKPFL